MRYTLLQGPIQFVDCVLDESAYFASCGMKVLSFTVPEKSKERTNWRAKKGDILGFLASILLHNIKKIERGPFGDIKKFSEENEKREF